MFEPNVSAIVDQLAVGDRVLDVGGWACPFNRAQWVLDSEPYETRGHYRTFGGLGSQGGEREWFSKQTWIQRDICDREPWPFSDKQFDFVVCSHTLEDLRDPVWVCAEMVRVAKRGYIEVPSRIAEATRGLERPGVVGLSHHRWLVDINGDEIRFLQKFHCIHSHWRYSLPRSFMRALPPERHVQWLFWEGRFEFREQFVHGLAAQEALLEAFVQGVRPRPEWLLKMDSLSRRITAVMERAPRRVLDILGRR